MDGLQFMVTDNNKKAFITLVRVGLWEKEAQLSQYGKVDYEEIMRLAEEQSVVGLITAGLEHVKDVKVSQVDLLQFIGQSLQLEQRNQGMNVFIAEITRKMKDAGICTLLVKGQGIAQCYERPLWRASGDVDFLLDEGNYRKAIDFLLPLSSSRKNEERYSSHLGISIDPWYVEVHGSLRTGLSARMDRMVDDVQEDTFTNRKVRVWKDCDTDVLLPEVNNDVFFVFTHFIKHFYKEGMNLRQICDWCRLLWTYKESIDRPLLELRINKAGLRSEWKAFAAVAVGYLGMPVEVMPFFTENDNQNGKLKRVAERLLEIILMDSTGSKVKDTYRIARLFPWHTIQFLPSIFFHLNWLKVKERVIKS